MNASGILNNLSKEGGVGYALLIGVSALAAVVIYEILKTDATKAAKAVGSAATATLDAASNFATGNTATAHGTPYEGTGIFGSLGADVNVLLGGAPQSFGEWIGEKISPSYDPNESSLQHANNNPYGGGPSSSYIDAVDSSPTAAQYAANPNTQTPTGVTTDFSADDGAIWQ